MRFRSALAKGCAAGGDRGSGSRRVRTVTSEGALDAALDEAAAASLDGCAMLEQFLSGSQHTVEGWRQKGRIASVLPTDRLTAPAPHLATACPPRFPPARKPPCGRNSSAASGCPATGVELPRCRGHLRDYDRRCFMSRRYRATYPPEFRRQMVELHCSGRSLQDLAKEFEPSLDAIADWVRQADAGRCTCCAISAL